MNSEAISYNTKKLRRPSWFQTLTTFFNGWNLDLETIKFFIVAIVSIGLFRDVSQIALSLYVLYRAHRSSKWLLIGLLFISFQLSISGFIVTDVVKILRFPMAMVLILISLRKTKLSKIRLGTILIMLVSVLFAFNYFNSQVMSVSILKVFGFSLMSLSCLLVFDSISRIPSTNYIINAYVLVVTIVSLISFVFGFAYQTGSFFDGAFDDSQVAGPIYMVLMLWIVYQYLIEKKKNRRLLFLAGVFLLFVYFSHSRNSLLSFGLGAVITYFLSTLNNIPIPNQRRFWGMIGSVFFLFILGFATDPKGFTLAALEYIQKGDESTNTTELFQQTRGELIEASMDNFYQNPITGIGFGVATDYQNFRERVQGALPTSASVEKGFLPSAVLEEQGLIGAVFLLIIIVHVTKTLIRKRSFMLLWLFFSTLFINIGEAALYSMGPLGLFMWIMIAYVYCYEPPKRKLLITNTA